VCVCVCVCVSVCVCVCSSCFKSTLHVIMKETLSYYSPKTMTIYSVSSRQTAGSQYADRPNLYHHRAEFNQT